MHLCGEGTSFLFFYTKTVRGVSFHIFFYSVFEFFECVLAKVST
jgi:hypothetical protein